MQNRLSRFCRDWKIRYDARYRNICPSRRPPGQVTRRLWASPPVLVPRWASPPPGNANAGSARAARVQPRGCKGRSPLHKKTKNLPLPRRGRGLGGWGRQSKLKTAAAGNKDGKPPAVSRFPQANPVPHPTQPRGCKGRSPLHKITLVSPFPTGEDRSASAGGGIGGRKAS